MTQSRRLWSYLSHCRCTIYFFWFQLIEALYNRHCNISLSLTLAWVCCLKISNRDWRIQIALVVWTGETKTIFTSHISSYGYRSSVDSMIPKEDFVLRHRNYMIFPVLALDQTRSSMQKAAKQSCVYCEQGLKRSVGEIHVTLWPIIRQFSRRGT